MDSQTPTSTANIHTIVKAQIVFLLSTLTEENFERNQLEIRSLSEQHGLDTYLHFIRRLIGQTQPILVSNAPIANFEASTALTFRLLVEEIQRLARDPFLADRFRDGVDKGEREFLRSFDFVRFAERIGLQPLERLILASSIANAPVRRELGSQAISVIKSELDDAVMSLCHNPSFDHADLSPNQVSKLMANLLSDLAEEPILDASQRQALMVAAQTKFGKEAVNPIILRILPTLTVSPGTTFVQFLVQLGSEITSETDVVRACLARYGISDSSPPRDAQLFEIMSTLSRMAAEGASLCDVPTLVRTLSTYPVVLDWAHVIQSFDWPDRHGVDTATLKLLIAILVNTPRDAETHAVAGFWMPWKNSLYQLRLLDALLSLPADTFNFVQLPGRKIVTVEDVAVASPTIKSLAANVQGHTWNSLDLFEVLVRLADSDSQDVQTCIREMLDKAIKISAELVHMGLLQVQDQPWNEIRSEYSRKLLGMFLAGHPNHQLVFMRIWQIEPKYLTDAFRDFYHENPLNITRILDVAQDLKILEALLDVRPFTFALDVAALASRREYLNLDKWLADNVANHGDEFLHSVLDFLAEKMQNEKITRLVDPQAEARTMPLNVNTISIILRMLKSNTNLLPQQDQEYAIEVRNDCLQIHPRLMSLSPGSDGELSLNVVNYSSDIEVEVDDIYKQMYDESTSIDDVILMLQRYKTSPNPRDHEVFSCMIHFLFDEYKFFQVYYPARELAMTGYLFGSLIQHSLIEYIPLGIAIRYILDALNCPMDSNLFKFGLQALSRFEFRLTEWIPLCETLLTVPNLAEVKPELISGIRRHLAAVAAGEAVPGPMSEVSGLPSSFNESLPAFSAIQPDDLDPDVKVPAEELSDKILFIVNNLAPSNFDGKVKDMKAIFDNDYARWFANYLVDQRVSSEPNNHSLYLRFLDSLERSILYKFVIHETLVKSVALLNSEKTMQAGNERNTLKNIGSWLGTITLARDKPIKYKNLAFKELLLEGFDNGRLQVAIPFVCKVLEGCTKSKVFKPPNPWLMAVMSLLTELYLYGELKLNFKFEIEVLCTSLDLDLSSIEPTTLVRKRAATESLIGPPLPDFVSGLDSLPMGDYTSAAQMLSANDSQVMSLGPSAVTEQRIMSSHIESILQTLSSHVRVNTQLNPLHVNPQFKRAVQLAVDRAVRDIILPVVERSVTIASISTRELVTKDFATDLNDDKLRKAGRSMSRKLAGSLALVTCKEPLKTNLGVHIRHSLTESGFEELLQQEQIVAILVQDNLDMACAAIESAAMERAELEVDEAFASSYETRRRHRDHRGGQGFWDPAAPPLSMVPSLPDPLRIKASGVQSNQSAIYDDFGMDLRRSGISRPSSANTYGRGGYAPTPPPDPNMISHNHQGAMDRFAVLARDIESIVTQTNLQSLAGLPPNHDLRHLIRQVLYLAGEALDRARTPLSISQKIVQFLYKTTSQLGRETYVALLDQLCHTFDDVAKEALTWLVYAEDERKLNVPVTLTLLRTGLISVSAQDNQLAKVLFADARPSLQNFAAGLLREWVSSDVASVSQGQFVLTHEVLTQLHREGKSVEAVNQLMDDLRGVQGSSGSGGLDTRKVANEHLRGKLVLSFQQWIAIFQRSSPEKNFVPFIQQLTKQGILKAEEVSSLFFRVCAETGVQQYMACAAEGDMETAYQALDALSRLIVLMIKYYGDASIENPGQAKVHYLTKILSIIVLVLAKTHEEPNDLFPQKPFFRFFSSLITDFHTFESEMEGTYFSLLIAISDAFSSLQPIYFPGFAFSWMCLISHRLFMPKLLLSENRDGWSAFHKLLLALFKFMALFLKDLDLQGPSRELYRGALRLLLVLIHDFSDFLSEHYFTLCDIIPPRCIQMRNIILCAFPPNIMLPDPYLPGISFESIPEMGPIPPILSDFTSALQTADLRNHLDQYLLSRSSPSFIVSLKERLKLPGAATDTYGETYNLSLMNSLVMYIGVSTVAQAKARSGSSLFIPTDPGVVALQFLSNNLDVEGQHHLLSAAVLHLRYPNAHTHWFSCLLLHLFAEVKDDRFREVMTKVLLERFIGHRPHPWGVLVTFIELVRNPKYDFWSKEFIHIAPEVNLLLQSVSRSVVGQK